MISTTRIPPQIHPRHALLLAALCCLCVSPLPAAPAPAAPAFDAAPYADALKRAAAEKKHLLALFSGEWIAEETQLKTAVLQDKQVAAALASRVITARVDAVRDKDLMQQFHIRALPTLILLNAAGDELARWAGVPKASALARDLSAVLNSGKPLPELNAPDKNASFKKHYKAGLALEQTGAYDPALKEYLLACRQIILSTDGEDVFYQIAALGKVFPKAEASSRDILGKYRAKIAATPDSIPLIQGTILASRALGDADAAISLYQQAQSSEARKELKWDAFAAFLRKNDLPQAVAVTTPDEMLTLINGKAEMPMWHLRKAIYGYFNLQSDPSCRLFRSDHFRTATELVAQILVFVAYAGVNDEQSAGEIAKVILGKNPKPERIEDIHRALESLRPDDAPAFAQKIGLPPRPAAPPTPAK